MFTGIVQHIGTVRSVRRGEASAALTIDSGPIAQDASVGDSICISGACLTARSIRGALIEFDVSAETLRLTTLGELREGAAVNMEPSLRIGDKLGGHFMSGHVDGVGTIERLAELPGEVRLRVAVEPRLTDDMIMKGSVAVDGISLTIAALGPGAFECSLIPQTMAATTMHANGPGDRVNIECDMIGRWVRRLVTGAEGSQPADGLSLSDLEEQGY